MRSRLPILNRFNRSGPRQDDDPMRRTALRALAIVALLGVVVYVAVTSYSGVPGKQYTTMYASAPAIGNLILHDQVRIAGIRVGQVLGTTVDDDGRVKIELQLEPDIELTKDTTVRIRANGLLGARFVQLIPGESGPTLAPGSTIRGGEDSLTFGVPDVLDTFDRETRSALGTMVDELGTGTFARGQQLNAALRVVTPNLPRFRGLAARIQARRGAAGRLLPSLDRAMATLDENRFELAGMFEPAAVALQPFVDRRAAVQAALEQAPPTLRATDAGLGDGVRLLAAARSLATEASRTLPEAPSGLRSTTALLRESHTPLRRTTALLREGRRAVPGVLRITASANPVLTPLRRGLDDLVPIVRRVGRYGCDIENIASIFRSMTGFGVPGDGPNGPLMHFRLQQIPSTAGETASAGDGSGLITRDGYPEPCKYLSGPYASGESPGAPAPSPGP